MIDPHGESLREHTVITIGPANFDNEVPIHFLNFGLDVLTAYDS